MTVGNVFLLIVLSSVIPFGIAYILYRFEVNTLRKKGYYDLSKVTCYSFWVFMSYLITACIFIFGFLLYKLIVNWNMPI